MSKKISNAVIKRLPKYYRYLEDLSSKGIVRVSSREISNKIGLTASQIRQDLNNFGGFGQQGYGYNVDYLKKSIEEILGLEKQQNVIIVGIGNLGHALANYLDFEERGFKLKGLFDNDKKLIGNKIRNIPIQPIGKLEGFIKNNNVEIASLTVPKEAAVRVAKDLVDYGIKGIWNFAPIDLDLKIDDIVVENVNLSDSLMTLSYMVKKFNGELYIEKGKK